MLAAWVGEWRDEPRELVRLLVEAALGAELLGHLARRPTDVRNGYRIKTVRSAFGPVPIAVPRSRSGTFEPIAVGRWQRDLVALDRVVWPLAAHGVPLNERVALVWLAYRDLASPELARQVARAIEDAVEPWHSRPLPYYHPELTLGPVVVVDGRQEQLGGTVLRLTPRDGGEVLGLWRQRADAPQRQLRSIERDLATRGLTYDRMVIAPTHYWRAPSQSAHRGQSPRSAPG